MFTAPDKHTARTPCLLLHPWAEGKKNKIWSNGALWWHSEISPSSDISRQEKCFNTQIIHLPFLSTPAKYAITKQWLSIKEGGCLWKPLVTWTSMSTWILFLGSLKNMVYKLTRHILFSKWQSKGVLIYFVNIHFSLHGAIRGNESCKKLVWIHL